MDDHRFKSIAKQCGKVLRELTNHTENKAEGLDNRTHAGFIAGVAGMCQTATVLAQQKLLTFIALVTLLRWTCARCVSGLSMTLGDIVMFEDASVAMGVAFMWNMRRHKTDTNGTRGAVSFPLIPDLKNLYLCPAFALTIMLLLWEDYYIALMTPVEGKVALTLSQIALFPTFTANENPTWGDGTHTPDPRAYSSFIRILAIRLAIGFRLTGHSGRHAISYIAMYAGLSLFEMMTWGGWRSLKELAGYMHRSGVMMLGIAKKMAGVQPAPVETAVLPYKFLPSMSPSAVLGVDFRAKPLKLFELARIYFKCASGEEFPPTGSPMAVRCQALWKAFPALRDQEMVYVPNVLSLTPAPQSLSPQRSSASACAVGGGAFAFLATAAMSMTPLTVAAGTVATLSGSLIGGAYGPMGLAALQAVTSSFSQSCQQLVKDSVAKFGPAELAAFQTVLGAVGRGSGGGGGGGGSCGGGGGAW